MKSLFAQELKHGRKMAKMIREGQAKQGPPRPTYKPLIKYPNNYNEYTNTTNYHGCHLYHFW